MAYCTARRQCTSEKGATPAGIALLAVLSERALGLLIGVSTIIAALVSLRAPAFRPSRPAYAAALAGYASGEPDGVAGWLVHCCRATEHGAVEGLAICEALLRG
jgi:hypothetical protein